MLKNNNIEVFSGLRWILKVTNLYNKNGVFFKYNKRGDSAKIPDFLIFCLVSLPTSYLVLLLIWFDFDERFNMQVIAFRLAATISYTQKIASYISFAAKTDLIKSTIDHLQDCVNKSK